MQEINQTIMQANYNEHLRLISYLFDYASEFLSTHLGKDYKMPIPVRQLAYNCGLIIYETSLCDLNAIERDSYGGFVKLAETTLRIRRYGCSIGEITGTIKIEETLSEYAKRYYIAHELARYILANKNEVHLLKVLPIARGDFSLYESISELFANTLAYGILMPYEQVMQAKVEYEEENSANPLSYHDWIDYLHNLAQIPEQYAILGYEELRKSQLAKS